MISFFRRALSSWIILALLGLIMVAFIITGVSAPSSMGAGDGGATVAKAGGTKISATELNRRVQNQFEGARRQQTSLDPKTFVSMGGYDQVAEALISARALDSWGKGQGFAISKRLVDAEIAGIPAFRGVTGQFDEAAMRAILSQQRVSERDLRNDIASDLLRGQILMPVAANVPSPTKVATPYAKLLLEQRTGQVGIVPLAAVADNRAPSAGEIEAAYRANIAAYTQPETRMLRYALFGAAQVAAQAKPSDSDVTAFYQANVASYAAKQTRDLTQVILPTEAAARAFAAKAKSGTSLKDAAAQAGLEAATVTKQTQADYANTANAAIAATVFTTPQGGIVGPVKGAFGWYVVHVDALTGTPARTIEQVRPEIVAALTAQKADEAMSELASKIEGQIGDGASFDEVAKTNGLTVVTTPALLQTGQSPATPDWKAPAELAALLRPGFDASPDDDPTVETVTKGQQYALLGVTRVIPPTPLPLAKVGGLVARDIVVKRTAARAKAIAAAIAAKVNKGVALGTALAQAGVPLPKPQPAAVRQIDLARVDPKQVPAALRELFSMKPGQAKLVPADNGGAFFVVVLDKVSPGDLAKAPGLIDQTRGELARATTAELAEQFIRAVQKDVGVTRNEEAIAQAKRQFAGAQ